MRFVRAQDEQQELTYEDVFLLPQHSIVHSRMDVDLTPAGHFGMTIPVVVANMNAVAGRRMAETVTRRGGLVVLPQDLSFERMEAMVRFVKARHHVFETPVVLKKEESVQTALNLISKRSHGAVMIIDDDGKPVGIFTEKDAVDRDRFSRLADVMTTDLITVTSMQSPEEIFLTLHERRVSLAPVVQEHGKLVGVMTKRGALRATLYRPAVNVQGELLSAAAVGIGMKLKETVELLMRVGVDILVLDAAHGDTSRMIEAIRLVRAMVGPDRPLAAGNIVTEEAALRFMEAGATILKVGVGPGAMCKTRMMTGVGRPQFSAVWRIARLARSQGVHVWADGGIKYPRDVALCLAAGAQAAMVGTWFAGTYESAADVRIDEHGRLFKENFGMASMRAVTDRTRRLEPFNQTMKQFFDEGTSHSRLYLKPGEESVEDILDQITAGIRSACTYAGARNLAEFYDRAVVGVQTQAGYQEGKAVCESW
ncbi:GuaB1 family IMP dehydrogenase-related protein [Candidatus Uhrbacteria bacterium]|nr:GuaB1 family IMP dehydrogenase-related protein [Candidatus Uhrbacteria bacterium]